MSGAPSEDPALRGPLARSVRLGFLMLYAMVFVLAAGWLTTNIRQVPPDSRAVVFRFGRVNRVQEAGLLLAWPTPIEQVRLLPAADRQIEYKIPAQKSGFESDDHRSDHLSAGRESCPSSPATHLSRQCLVRRGIA
jgi:hypothetical protein